MKRSLIFGMLLVVCCTRSAGQIRDLPNPTTTNISQNYPIPINSVMLAASNDAMEYCHMALVQKSQLECFHNLPAKDTIFYRNLIEWVSKIHPRLIGEIERQDPTSTICRVPRFNIVDGISLGSSYLSGLIWVDSSYYSYFNNGETEFPQVKKLTFYELSKEQRTMITHFSDWSHEIFKNKETSPLGTQPPIFHIGTRVSLSDQPSAESIAFCY
jgi:hypothetical protein